MHQIPTLTGGLIELLLNLPKLFVELIQSGHFPTKCLGVIFSAYKNIEFSLCHLLRYDTTKLLHVMCEL